MIHPFLTAPVLVYPHETCFHAVPAAIVCTGELLLVIELSPSCPKSFRPQHQTEPSTFTAAVCLNPQATYFQLVPPLMV